MPAWIEPKKNISEGKKSPHEEGIENCSCPTDEAKAQDSTDLFRKGAGSGSGMGMGDLGHRNKNGEKEADRQTGKGWYGLPSSCGKRSSGHWDLGKFVENSSKE
jgi:hypothetical protein